MYPRLFNPPKSSSFFLFGARGTGKSTLLRQFFDEKEVLVIDLLETDYLSVLQANPSGTEPNIRSKHEALVPY